MDQSGLAKTRPRADLTVTQPVGYRQLLEHVRIHGYHLMQERGEVLPPEVIATTWYDKTYLPTIDAIRAEGLDELMPDRTITDTFLWIHQRRWRLLLDDESASYEEAVREAAAERKAKSLPGRTKTMMEKVEGAIEDVVDRITDR